MGEKINEAHEELLKVLSGLEAQDYLRPMAPGKWPVRDLIAHLIYWNQWGLDFLRERLAGNNPLGFSNDFDIDRLNQEATEQWAEHSPEQLLEELDQIRRATVDIITEIGPQGLKEKWNDNGKKTEIGEFIDSFAGHQTYHCKQIQAWRDANNI